MSESQQITISLKELHPGQQRVMNEHSRFNVLCCGRRWGKTNLCEDLILSPDDESNGILHGFPVGYFAPTYRMLMEVWREVNDVIYDLIVAKSETEKRIEIVGGGVVDFWSLEDPNSIRGRKYKRAIVDEAAVARNLQEAWLKVIRPTLTDLEGDAWFLSTPKGKNNYFFNLYENSKTYLNWRSWQMPTIANPLISEIEVEEARAQLDPLTFAQEYLASFVTENIDAWAYCFDPNKHVGGTKLNRAYETILTFDFNRNPMTCGVLQDYNETIFGIEQIKLANSDIYKMCDYILAKYPNCMYMVTGDATGKNSSALAQDNINFYTVIKAKLKLSMGQLKVPVFNPKVSENRVLVNSVLHNKKCIFDKVNCKHLIFDFENVRVLPDGSIDKSDRTDPTKQADALDSFRYFCNTFYKHILKQ